jgi:hypothetical protein
MISTFMRADGGDVVEDDVIGATSDDVSRGAASVVVKPVLGCVAAAAVVGAGVVVAVVGDGGADVVSTTTGIVVVVSDVADKVVDAIATGDGEGASTAASTSRRCRVMGAAISTTGAATLAAPHCSFCSILRRSCLWIIGVNDFWLE